MPAPITPRSGGHRENGEMPGEAQRLAGEIMISKAEAAALSALHLGSSNPKRAFDRARAESGFSMNQILRLQARAKRAQELGITLKGERFVLKPYAPKAPDEPGLLRDDVMDVRSKGKSGATGQPTQAASEGVAMEAAVVLPLLEAATTVLDFTTALREAREAGFEEAWSDAARAASAAARRSRAKGGDWRKAGRTAFVRSGSGQKMAVKSLRRAERTGGDADGRNPRFGAKLKRMADLKSKGAVAVARGFGKTAQPHHQDSMVGRFVQKGRASGFNRAHDAKTGKFGGSKASGFNRAHDAKSGVFGGSKGYKTRKAAKVGSFKGFNRPHSSGGKWAT